MTLRVQTRLVEVVSETVETYHRFVAWVGSGHLWIESHQSRYDALQDLGMHCDAAFLGNAPRLVLLLASGTPERVMMFEEKLETSQNRHGKPFLIVVCPENSSNILEDLEFVQAFLQGDERRMEQREIQLANPRLRTFWQRISDDASEPSED